MPVYLFILRRITPLISYILFLNLRVLLLSLDNTRGSKIPLPAITSLLQGALKYFPCGYTFYLPEYTGRAICRNRLRQKMRTILFCPYFQKSYLNTFLYLYTYLITLTFLVFAHPSSILIVSTGSSSGVLNQTLRNKRL
jgi:hypothetical protein